MLLLHLPDEFLSRVLAGVAPKPFKASGLLAVCKRFFRLLSEMARLLTLTRAVPSPTVLKLLRSAISVRHVDITLCRSSWPLSQLLPHLPNLESVEMEAKKSLVEALSRGLQKVHLARFDVNAEYAESVNGFPTSDFDANSDCVARLHDHLEHGTVVIKKLDDGDFERSSQALHLRWGREGVRTPVVMSAHVQGEMLPYICRLTSLTALKLSNSEYLSMPSMDMSATYMESLPDEISCLVQLRSLEIGDDGYSLASMPPAIGRLPALRRLALMGCEFMEVLPAEMGQLNSLKELCIRDCCLESLPETVSELSSLTKLELCDCIYLTHLPEGLSSLHSLRHLCLGLESFDLQQVVRSLRHVTTLQVLELQSAYSAAQLRALSSLTSLQELKADLSQVLGSCPRFLACLVHLTSLDLRECTHITEFQDVSSLANLQTLRLDNACALTSFPRGIASLKHLRRFEAYALREVPDVLSALSAVTFLKPTQCEWGALPGSIGHLSSLQHLEISFGALRTLPAAAFELRALTQLSIACQRLVPIPEALGALTSLRQLQLFGCEALETVPTAIGELTALSMLELNRCIALTMLPTSLGNLTGLSSLNLQNCWSLRELPDSIGGLSTLQDLNLEKCTALTALPQSIGNLAALSVLNLSNCQSLTTLPYCVNAFPALTRLVLSKCTSLSGINDLPLLKSLDIRGCFVIACDRPASGHVNNFERD